MSCGGRFSHRRPLDVFLAFLLLKTVNADLLCTSSGTSMAVSVEKQQQEH